MKYNEIEKMVCETNRAVESGQDDPLQCTEKELNQMMKGVCPRCPLGIPIEEKLDDVDTWRITCPCCWFSVIHHLPPILRP